MKIKDRQAKFIIWFSRFKIIEKYNTFLKTNINESIKVKELSK